jgi:hypothetical protein
VDLYSTAALVLNGTAPFSDRTYLVANCYYLIGFNDIVVAMQSGKHLTCIPFFDCLPTGIQSFRRYLKRVLREERSDGGRVILVERLVILLTPLTNLPGYLWIYPLRDFSEACREELRQLTPLGTPVRADRCPVFDSPCGVTLSERSVGRR